MLYAIAVICASLVVLALIGKPIRIEIIHTVTESTQPQAAKPEEPPMPEGLPAALQAVAYVNQIFHNTGEELKNGNTD